MPEKAFSVCIKDSVFIDPPYNTGHDFVYNDTFARTAEEERSESGAFDREGNLRDKAYVENKESNGRFHSDWCSMMYPRLMLARDLLTDEGVIFISIDDYELNNLLRLGADIFGESSYLATFVWKRRTSSALDSRRLSTDHEYVVAYSGRVFFALNGTPKTYETYSNPDNDPRGPWTPKDLTVGMNGDQRPNQYYDLIDPVTGIVYKPNFNRVWAYIPESMDRLIAEGRILFPSNSNRRPMLKRFVSDLKSDRDPYSTWMANVGLNSEGTKAVYKLFDDHAFFSYAKPLSLISGLLKQVIGSDDIVLDFFSGSATTAHAVMQLNAEDGGNRKFIMVQLPEVCDEKSEAAKAGYKNICEIGKERIRRAGAKIAAEVEEANARIKLGEEPRKVPDIGFRVLKIDSSNFEDVSRTPDAIQQDQLFGLADNLKPGRTPEDILFQLFPQLEIPYTARIDKLDICGKTVYSVNDDTLLACFDREVPEDVIRAMAEREPAWAVLRDGSFAGDDALTNFEEIFKTVSPETKTRVV